MGLDTERDWPTDRRFDPFEWSLAATFCRHETCVILCDRDGEPLLPVLPRERRLIAMEQNFVLTSGLFVAVKCKKSRFRKPSLTRNRWRKLSGRFGPAVNPAPGGYAVPQRCSLSFLVVTLPTRFDLVLGDGAWPYLMKLLGTSTVVMTRSVL
jgi:hypothetical protein